MSRKVLNFAPVAFAEESKSYGLYQIPYVDEHQLAGLREAHNATNSFFRFGNMIYHSPMVAEGGFQGGEHRMFHVEKDVEQTKAFVHRILFRKVFENDLNALSFYPIKFLSNKPDQNMIRALMDGEEESNRISFRRGQIIDTRVWERGRVYTYGVLFSLFYAWEIEIPCSELLERGVDILDCFVMKKGILSEELQPARILVGRLKEIKGVNAVIQGKSETITLPLDQLFLENSFSNRTNCLGEILTPEKNKEIDAFLLRDRKKMKGANSLGNKNSILIDHFMQMEFSNQNGFGFKIEKFVDSDSILWKEIPIEATVYFFDADRKEQDVNQLRGLRSFGPFSRYEPKLRNPLVLVFHRISSEQHVVGFIEKFKIEFISKYHLSGIEFKFYPISGSDIAHYRKQIKLAIEECANPIPSLAIVENSSQFLDLSPEKDPYLFCKAILLNRGIPSQEIKLETMMLAEPQLGYILNNIWLAIYAKMGGIPWKILSTQKAHHDIVFGLGHKMINRGRFGHGDRIVGISTIFTGDGEYLLGKRSNAVRFEDYFEELKRKLVSDISHVKNRFGWELGQKIRIIFHVFKPFNKKEIAVIKKLVRDLEYQYDLEFAFLTFSTIHDYFLLGESYDTESSRKMFTQPIRNSNMRIDDWNHLVQLTGSAQIRSGNQGLASPLLIHLHRSSTFTDLDYLVRQVSMFASNSWKSVDLISIPITISYPNQIASVYGKMMHSTHFDETSAVDARLDDKVWFL